MSVPILASVFAGTFDAGSAIVAGLVGALAMLIVMYGGKAMGMTSMDLLRTLGTMIAPRADKAIVYAVGLMVHLMMGAAFGLVHVGILHVLGPSSEAAAAGLGLAIGLVHGLMMVGVMPVMVNMAHPLVRSGDMPAPGTAMTGYGKMTPMGMVLAHGVFGLVTGAVYAALVIV